MLQLRWQIGYWETNRTGTQNIYVLFQKNKLPTSAGMANSGPPEGRGVVPIHPSTNGTPSLSARPSTARLTSTAFPIEREVVIALANSPGVLNFYVWIAWKSWVLTGGKVSSSIPLFAPGGLREQLGCRIHPEDRFLRRKNNQ